MNHLMKEPKIICRAIKQVKVKNCTKTQFKQYYQYIKKIQKKKKLHDKKIKVQKANNGKQCIWIFDRITDTKCEFRFGYEVKISFSFINFFLISALLIFHFGDEIFAHFHVFFLFILNVSSSSLTHSFIDFSSQFHVIGFF